MASDINKDKPIYAWDQQYGITFHTTADQFQQVNHTANQQLRNFVRKEVLDALEDRGTILDLYSGSGNLSLPLAKVGKFSIRCVEQEKKAIQVGRLNKSKNQLSGIEFIEADSGKYLRQFTERQETADLLLIDPPRAGIGNLLNSVLVSGIEYLIYVSCNPTTLARDLGMLKTKYEVRKVHCFDFFPDTYHIETVTVLKLRRSLPEDVQS